MKKSHVYYAVSMLNNLACGFIMPIYSIFLLSKGLNIFQIGLVNLMFYVGLFIFEIPTGVIADAWGRKICVIISGLVRAVAFFVYAFADSILLCMLAELLCAFGNTFANGAFQAWYVDHAEENENFTSVFSREQVLGRIMHIVGAIVGSICYSYSARVPWIVGGLIGLVTAIISQIIIHERKIIRRDTKSISEKYRESIGIFQTSIRFCRTSKPFRFLLLIGFIQMFAVQAPNMQWSPHFQSLVTTSCLGLLSTAICISLIVGSYLSVYIIRIVKDDKWSLVISQMIIGIGLIAAGYFGQWISLLAFLVHEIGRGAFRPLQDNYLNRNIPSGERATLISFQSMSQHIGGALGLVVTGWLAQQCTINFAWIFSGVILIVITFVIKNGKKNKS